MHKNKLGQLKIMDLILNIISLGLKPLYEKHYSFYTITNEFRNKLLRIQNRAHKMTKEELKTNPFLSDVSKMMTVVDLTPQKINLTESDIDLFYNKLNNFDYQFIIFKRYYKSFTSNLNRFNPKAENSNFDIAIVQDILIENKYRPLKPFPILLYHLKYKYKISSWIYKLRMKLRKT